ncbi:hypothetical protein T02_11617 [Trichinella nativa]|uniref:Uncharacterized protein n=2 Tax=Trichinella TaxID=6333 RepID=A0A0V1KJT5_9BILA|nr:hypothetical protein T05_11341 [Trichinella murrelli]KRZ47533.1 hypothetical protein T02_11617 [Trichinella nativa]
MGISHHHAIMVGGDEGCGYLELQRSVYGAFTFFDQCGYA